MAESLNGKSAVVTGGSRGYGAGIAAVLKQAGAEVWITGRDEATVNKTAAQLDVHGVPADITKGTDWDRVIQEVLDAAGRLDILVNNAGSAVAIKPLAEQSDDSIEQSIAVNLTGSLLGCCREGER